MPKIEQFTRTELPTQFLQGRRATARDFGGDQTGLFAQAQASREIGASIEQLSNTVQEIQRKRDELKYNERIADIMLQNEIRRDELSKEEFPEDTDFVATYENDFKERMDALKETVPKSMQERFAADAARMRVNFVSGGLQEQSRRAGIRSKLLFENTLDSASNMIAMNPTRYAEARALISNQIAALPPMSSEERAVILDDAFDKLQASRAESIITKSPDLFKKMVNDGEFADLPNLSGFISKAETAKKAELAERKRIVSEARNHVASVKDRLTDGFEIPQEEMAQIQTFVKSVNDPETSNMLNSLLATQKITVELKKLSPIELQDVINSELIPATKEDGATDFEVLMLNQAQNTLTKMKTAIESDPISYAASTGVAVQPIDVNNPNTISARINTAISVAEKYGTDIKPLTDEEISSLSVQIKKANAQDRFEFIKSISKTGRDSGFVFKQLGQTDNVFAHAGGLLAVSPASANDVRSILVGQKSLEDNPDFKPEKQLVDAAFNEYVGDALRMIPQQEAALKKAAVAHYIGSGAYDGKFNNRDFEESLEKALGGPSGGGVASRKGRKFVLPAGASEDDFDDFLDVASDDTYKFFAVNGQSPTDLKGRAVTADQIRKYGQFETIDHGIYRVKINDKYLLGGGPDGTYILRIDARAIKEIIKGR